MDTIVEVLHKQNTPALLIAKQLKLPYQKVYQLLRWVGLRPIPIPSHLCRKGIHDTRVLGRRRGCCIACQRELYRRDNARRRAK